MRFRARIQVGVVAGFLNNRESAIHRRRVLVRLNPGGAHPNLFYPQSFAGQRLAYAPDTRSAMHSIDTQYKFCHRFPYMD